LAIVHDELGAEHAVAPQPSVVQALPSSQRGTPDRRDVRRTSGQRAKSALRV
jgi:hypothetical protein